MANNPQKKRVVVTTGGSSSSLKATKSRADKVEKKTESGLIFGKENYKWVAIGVGLILLGMILMIGGFNEDPSVWNEDKIYGFQRTVLAPAIILAGLVVEVFAIFK